MTATGRAPKDESGHPHARADFWTGLVLIVLGLAAFLACLDMPRFEERQINPYTIPGLVPGMISLVIAVLGFSSDFSRSATARPRKWRGPK